MKKKLFMIPLCCLVLFVFYISLTALATMIYMPSEFLASLKRQWWEENRADMESSGLYASKPVIQTTPMNGLNMHGERTITDSDLPVSLILSELWTPYKPENYHYIKISIVASGYGEVAFILNGESEDFSIGRWTSEPLQKAERMVYTFTIKVPNGVVNPNLPDYDADQISPITVSISATGSAETRSRRITTYGSEQTALSAQAGTSGAGIGFVIGESSYWKWAAGITRSVDADPYNGSYSVTINDKIWGACGIHRIDPSEAEAHKWQDNCPINITQNGANVYCTVKGFYKCDSPHTHQFPNSGSGSQSGNGGDGDGTGNNDGGQQGNNGDGTGNNGGDQQANAGGPTPPSNGGCTTTAACINTNCQLDTVCATFTCIRAIKLSQRDDGTWITEPCGESFTKCQDANNFMHRGTCSRLADRLNADLVSGRRYHSDIYE